MDKKSRNGVFDIIKILATLCIVMHHYQQLTGAKFSGFNFWGDEHFYFGYLVELFFLISGILCHAEIKKIRDGKNLREYWGRKYLRFVPQMAASVVVYEAFSIYYHVSTGEYFLNTEINLGGALATALGFQNWGFPKILINFPLWYLSVLFLCYLLLYLFVRISEKNVRWNVQYSCAVMIVLGCMCATNNWEAPFFNHYNGRGYYAFFFGIILRELMNRWKSKSRYLICGSVFVIFSCAIVLFPDITGCGVDTWYGANLFLVFIYYPALVLFLDNPFLVSRLSRNGIAFLAKISAGTFIWHNVIHVAFVIIMVVSGRYYDVSAPVIVGLIVILDYIVGTVSYFFAERGIKRVVEKKPQHIN